MSALLCALCLSSAAAFGETLPDGKGKAEFVQNCTACHRADMVTRVKKTPDDWRKSVDEMAARGTDGTKEDLDSVVLYLDKYYAADKPGPPAATQPATPSSTSTGSATSPASLSASQVERVKHVITENGCLGCHRFEEQGTYTGPPLNGVGVRRTAAEIRTTIATSHPTLNPSNNLVRLTTATGTTIAGRILSQDDHDVRVIDASGEITTYSKSGLRQFTIINTNPMPPFEGKISGEDLDNLVRYLSALP